MTGPSRAWVGALVAVVVLVAPAAAAADAPTPVTPPLVVSGVDTSGYPQVGVRVGIPPQLTGSELPDSAFSVQENGVSRPVTATRLPGGARQVILLIDTSGSMAGAPITAAKNAAIAFVGRLPNTTGVGVIGFSRSPTMASPVGLNRAATSAAIQALDPKGETALYDAVTMAIESFQPGTSIHDIVLLSDGGDTVSTATLSTVTAKLASTHTHLDTVSLLTPDSNPSVLSSLATAGGGKVLPAQDPAALSGLYLDLASELNDEYQLTFSSAAHGMATLRVSVDVDRTAASVGLSISLPPAPIPPAPPATPVATPPSRSPVLAGKGALLVGAVAIFCALAFLLSLALDPKPRHVRLARLGRATPADRAGAVTELANRALSAADAALDRRGRRTTLNAFLEHAGVALRPAEFVVLVASGSAIAALLGLATGGLVLGLVGGAAVPLAARTYLTVLANRRRAKFGDQLGDTLQLMAGSLRAGYGLLQAVDAVAREAESPTREEFRRLVVETRLGRDLSESLAGAQERVGTEDFAWVVQAIEIHREIGGDLAEVLDSVAGTIRERNQLRRQVKALSAEGRLSAYVLLALPLVLALFMRVRNPGYFSELTHGAGLVLTAIGLAGMVLGAIWLRKLCRLAV